MNSNNFWNDVISIKHLGTFLSLEEPAKDLYASFENLMNSLITEDKRWPLLYANWEFTLLSALGYLRGLRECLPDYRHGDAIYLAPTTGRLYPRERVGAFLDRMLPVPGFLMGARNGSIVEVKQAMKLNSLMFETFALEESGKDALPVIRQDVLETIEDVASIPVLPKNLVPAIDEEARKKRLLSLRPLLVSKRVNPTGTAS